MADLLQSSGFSFDFGLEEVKGDESSHEGSALKRAKLGTELPEKANFVPESGCWAVITRDYVCAGFSFRKGVICEVDWSKSMQSALYVVPRYDHSASSNCNSGENSNESNGVGSSICGSSGSSSRSNGSSVNEEGGLIPVSNVRLIVPREDSKEPHLHAARIDTTTATTTTTTTNDTLIFYDSVFEPTSFLTRQPHYCEFALDLEAGLESFVWPLTSREFFARVFKKRALGILGSAQRLSQLEKDFCEFDVPTLLKEATKIVVWMKTTTGTMQYLEAPAEIALSCYLAGHSLYFNPSMETQKQFIKTLCQDLNMDFGLEKDGGFGGDLEIFAVNGAHDTPWHFDGQENFTIQLKGTKRWSMLPSGITDPLTNYHPRTSNIEGRDANLRRHRSYTNASLDPVNTSEAQSLVLRPGSVLYVPSGMWHRVVAGKEGSLSINFSVDGARWLDVFLSRIGPLLWRNSEFRSRVEVLDPNLAIDHFDKLLGVFRAELDSVKASDFLPQSGFLNQRDDSNIVDITLTSDILLQVNPLCVCTPSPSNRSSFSHSFNISHGWSHPDSASDFSAAVEVVPSLLCVIPWLMSLQKKAHSNFYFRELEDLVQKQNLSLSQEQLSLPLVRLCRSLIFHGFISCK